MLVSSYSSPNLKLPKLWSALASIIRCYYTESHNLGRSVEECVIVLLDCLYNAINRYKVKNNAFDFFFIRIITICIPTSRKTSREVFKIQSYFKTTRYAHKSDVKYIEFKHKIQTQKAVQLISWLTITSIYSQVFIAKLLYPCA